MAKRSGSSGKRSRKTATPTDESAPSAQSGDTIATQVAEYVGTSLGKLLNQRDRLVRQVTELDRRISAAGGRVASTIAERLPGMPGLSDLPGTPQRPAATRAARTERKGNRKKHRGKPGGPAVTKQTLDKRSSAATGRSGAKKRAAARSGRQYR